jgi:hypothetical protein
MEKILLLVLLCASQLRAQTSNILRINAAATAPVTDSTGQVWQPDSGPPVVYNSGTPASCAPTATTTGTPNPMLYKSARKGQTTSPMVYTFNGLPSGNYQVTLYFAECFWTAAGERVFNVQMQSNPVFSNVDIWAAVGGNVAYTLTAQSINVPTSGTLTISFQPITGKDVPLIDAIQIAPAQAHAATLNWTDTVNPAGSTYNVYRATGSCPASTFTKIAAGVPGFKYVDSTIAPQTGYCYQITALVAATESLPCSAVYLPGSVTSCNCQ